ncbi:hypothetical protein EVA_20637 [gut metagenome]|uniref:Uncharacterized protein n=1 Tax=gut metagenome TaxID=749906 RepID=J9F8M6_9ZZZZ
MVIQKHKPAMLFTVEVFASTQHRILQSSRSVMKNMPTQITFLQEVR